MEYEKIKEAAEYIRSITDFVPEVAVVLGSGLDVIDGEVEPVAQIDYKDVPGFPVSTVQGHKGRFVFCTLYGVNVAFMRGRTHYYEGYDMQKVVMPIRLLNELGCKIALLTNAAGGIAPTMKAGDLMIIKDHISSFVPSPLVGKNYPKGTRFPDMSHVYDPKLCEILSDSAAELGISIKEGIYLQMSGPNYETPAEVRMCRLLGADAVGMSTACEAMAAVHCGMKVCGISLISNLAAGISPTPLDHDEVREAGDAAAPKIRKLIKKCIEKFRGEI